MGGKAILGRLFPAMWDSAANDAQARLGVDDRVQRLLGHRGPAVDPPLPRCTQIAATTAPTTKTPPPATAKTR